MVVMTKPAHHTSPITRTNLETQAGEIQSGRAPNKIWKWAVNHEEGLKFPMPKSTIAAQNTKELKLLR